jgi:polar amino acid transport system substrate-binding protein
MDVRNPLGRSVAVALAAVASAGALAACGGGSGGGSGSGATSGSGSSQQGTNAASASVGKLMQSGTIHYCSDISAPPLEFYANGTQASGSDIELGNAIAGKLGLKPVWVNTAFSGIIPALQAGHCDAIISQLYDKPARRKVVNFVDYMNSSEALLVAKGNPHHIAGLTGLCGLNVAAETGTTISVDLAQQSKRCTSSGKKPITVQTFLRDSDALEQLGLGHVDAYGTTLESGAYDMTKNSGNYQFAGKPFGQILTGIATRKGDTQLHKAIAHAFAQVRADGQYKSIFAKWHLSGDELK